MKMIYGLVLAAICAANSFAQEDTALVKLPGCGPMVNSLAFSSDFKLVAAHYRDGIAVWSLPDGKLVNSFEHKKLAVGLHIAFTPDNAVVLLGLKKVSSGYVSEMTAMSFRVKDGKKLDSATVPYSSIGEKDEDAWNRVLETKEFKGSSENSTNSKYEFQYEPETADGKRAIECTRSDATTTLHIKSSGKEIKTIQLDNQYCPSMILSANGESLVASNNDGIYFINIAALEANQQEQTGEIAKYEGQIKADPADAAAYFGLALAYRKLDKHQDSLGYLAKSLELKPSAEAYAARGETYFFALKDNDKALADFSAAVKLDPGAARAYLYRGMAYHALDQAEAALKDYSKAIGLDAGLLEAYMSRGAYYFEAGKLAEALADLSVAIKIDPAGAEQAYFLRGLIRDKRKETEKALEDYSAAIKLNPRHGQAYYRRSVDYANKNLMDKAVADLLAAQLNGVTMDSECLNYLAVASMKKGEYRKANNLLRDAINLDSRYAPAWFNKGLLFMETGDYETGRDCFKFALEARPYDETYKKFLGIAEDMILEAAAQAREGAAREARRRKWEDDRRAGLGPASADPSGSGSVYSFKSQPITFDTSYKDERFKSQSNLWYQRWEPNSYNPYKGR